MLSLDVAGRARTQPTTIFPRFGHRTQIVVAIEQDQLGQFVRSTSVEVSNNENQ